MRKPFTPLFVFLLLFFVIAAIYIRCLNTIFILDDYVWIEPLTRTQIWHLFVGSWEHGNTLRPIMRLQFLSDRLLFGENPFFWHLTNIFFHATVSFVGYVFIKKITHNNALAILAALTFAIFPANHETVAWISGRTHPFGLLLSLAAGYLLYQSFRAPKKQFAYILGGYGMLLLAYLTYEVSFAAPFILTASLVLIGPRTKKAGIITAGSFFLLGLLIFYRMQVLGGSIGSVGQNQNNIFLAPFMNVPQLFSLFLYSKELKILIFLFTATVIIPAIKYKVWNKDNRLFRISLFLVTAAVLAYLPFAIVQGVAPRFLYTSLFFFVLALAVWYELVKKSISLHLKKVIFLLVIFILGFSTIRTWEVVNRYKEVADTQKNIIQKVTADFPEWPQGKSIIFYNVPDSNKNVLAYLTYFDLAIKREYDSGVDGEIYRAERLPPDYLKKVLARDPITYRFIDFGKSISIERITP